MFHFLNMGSFLGKKAGETSAETKTCCVATVTTAMFGPKVNDLASPRKGGQERKWGAPICSRAFMTLLGSVAPVISG